MRELTQVCKAVVEALKSAGVTALEAFPDSAKRYEGAVAAVTVGAAEGKTLGFCNYLGEVQDSATGAVRELYGKQLEGNITVDIRAERAGDCEAGSETATEALLGAFRQAFDPGASLGGADLGESHGNVFAAGKFAVSGGIHGGEPGGRRGISGLYFERGYET